MRYEEVDDTANYLIRCSEVDRVSLFINFPIFGVALPLSLSFSPEFVLLCSRVTTDIFVMEDMPP